MYINIFIFMYLSQCIHINQFISLSLSQCIHIYRNDSYLSGVILLMLCKSSVFASCSERSIVESNLNSARVRHIFFRLKCTEEWFETISSLTTQLSGKYIILMALSVFRNQSVRRNSLKLKL